MKKMYKHFCAYCIAYSNQAAHPEKDCTLVKKSAKKRTDRCSGLGSNLDSLNVNVNSSQTHQDTPDDIVHMSNDFNNVFTSELGVNVSSMNNVYGHGPTLNNRGRTSISVKHPTKCFHHSDLDRKSIEGLIARDNKAKALQLHNRFVRICPRTFVPCPSPIVTGHTSAVCQLDYKISKNLNSVTN